MRLMNFISLFKYIMKLDCILTSCDLNELYCEFIPIFIKSWLKLIPTISIKIILIANHIPEKIQQYSEYIVLFPQIPNISSAFTSQYIRLLYPSLINCSGGILITDMDMLPMNSKYYVDNIKNISDDKFIYYRNVLLDKKQIAMCYNVALPETWKQIFNIHTIKDIQEKLTEVNSRIRYDNKHGGSGWSTDQIDLFNIIEEWNKKTKNFVYLHDNKTNFKRLDRTNLKLTLEIENNIKRGYYSDYHALRPYSKYKEINNKIIDFLS